MLYVVRQNALKHLSLEATQVLAFHLKRIVDVFLYLEPIIETRKWPFKSLLKTIIIILRETLTEVWRATPFYFNPSKN